MDLVALLKGPDGKTLEFKRDLSAPTGSLKTIVAFGLGRFGMAPRADLPYQRTRVIHVRKDLDRLYIGSIYVRYGHVQGLG